MNWQLRCHLSVSLHIIPYLLFCRYCNKDCEKEESKFVCASDGNLYRNSCEMKKAYCGKHIFEVKKILISPCTAVSCANKRKFIKGHKRRTVTIDLHKRTPKYFGQNSASWFRIIKTQMTCQLRLNDKLYFYFISFIREIIQSKLSDTSSFLV